MPASDNPFSGLSTVELTTIRAQWLQVLSDIAGGGQSYTMGRTFTRAHIAEVRNTLSEIAVALRLAGGSGKTTAQAKIYQP